VAYVFLARSLAIYGAKAATGVVAITTKKGIGDKPVLTANINWRVAPLVRKQRAYDGSGFLKWRADVGRAGGKYNPDGTLRRIPTGDSGLNARNPFLNMTYNDRMNKQNTLFASLFAKVNLPFGITYQFNFSPGIEVGHVHQTRPLFNFHQQNMNKPRRQRSDWSSDRMMGERNPAVHQLNFVKTACEVAKLDLTDFFNKYGFFFVGTLEYDDYGKYTYTMTQEMVDACRLAIKNMNLPKPKADLTALRD